MFGASVGSKGGTRMRGVSCAVRAVAALLAVSVLGAPGMAPAQTRDPARVLVLQSAGDPLALRVQWAGRGWREALIVASSDCVEAQPDAYMRVSLSGPRTPAEVETAAAVSASLGTCTRKPGSLAARGISAVDASFAGVRTPRQAAIRASGSASLSPSVASRSST